MSNKKVVIFGPPFAGKTTAHREGWATDPEELPSWLDFKQRYQDGTEEWRAKRSERWPHFLTEAAESSDVIITHVPNNGAVMDWWRERGFTIVLYLPVTLAANVAKEAATKQGRPWWPDRVRQLFISLDRIGTLAATGDYRLFDSYQELRSWLDEVLA